MTVWLTQTQHVCFIGEEAVILYYSQSVCFCTGTSAELWLDNTVQVNTQNLNSGKNRCKMIHFMSLRWSGWWSSLQLYHVSDQSQHDRKCCETKSWLKKQIKMRKCVFISVSLMVSQCCCCLIRYNEEKVQLTHKEVRMSVWDKKIPWSFMLLLAGKKWTVYIYIYNYCCWRFLKLHIFIFLSNHSFCFSHQNHQIQNFVFSSLLSN